MSTKNSLMRFFLVLRLGEGGFAIVKLLKSMARAELAFENSKTSSGRAVWYHPHMSDIPPVCPKLRQNLLPPEPENRLAPEPKTRGRSKKAAPEPEQPNEYEQTRDDLTNLGPVLLRSRKIHDNYMLTLRNDQNIPFHRADWTSSGDDNFITFYRKTATCWEVMDISVDDISCVSISIVL